jgi:phosphatidylglycerol:prolipoprotein diacylglycerol transferase
MTYGTCHLIGLVLYFLMARRAARHLELKRRIWIVTGLCYLLGMTVGAKALFDLRHGQFALRALLDHDHYRAGGLWGGLPAYFALAIPLVLLLTKRRRAGLDLLAVSIPVPWIVGKVGCLLNGCCHGRPCALPWAITFPEGARGAPPGVPLHPTQLYEVGIMLVLLGVFALLRSDRWRGTKLLWFLLIYGLGRAATDFLRGDNPAPIAGPFTLTQVLCLSAAVCALAVLAVIATATHSRPTAATLSELWL